MYWKDQIRGIANRLLKIDRDYLTKAQILAAYSNSFDSGNEAYELIWNDQKLTLRNNSSDFKVFKQVLLDREYEFPADILMDLIEENIEPIIFDVGANIGLTSLYFQSRFPLAKIYAVEPSNDNYQLLNDNLKTQGGITTIKKGLWKTNEILKLNNNQRDRREWSFHLDAKNGFENVESTTLGSLLEAVGEEFVHLLKIDIEGAEKQVFFEDEAIAESLSKVKILCLEIHDEVVSRKGLIDFIASCSFRVYAKGETIIGVRT